MVGAGISCKIMFCFHYFEETKSRLFKRQKRRKKMCDMEDVTPSKLSSPLMS